MFLGSASNFFNPNSHAPFSFLDYLLGEGGFTKWGFPLVSNRGDLPLHNALSTYGTPPGVRCPGSNFVPIWDLFLWHNQIYQIFFTSPWSCWILLDWDRLGLKQCLYEHQAQICCFENNSRWNLPTISLRMYRMWQMLIRENIEYPPAVVWLKKCYNFLLVT